MRLIWIVIFCLVIATPAHAIKIGLFTNTKNTVYVGVSKEGVIIDADKKAPLLLLKPMKPYKLKWKKDFTVVSIDNNKYRVNAKNLIIRSNQQDGLVYVKRKWYKGNLSVSRKRKGLTVINEIDVENYIKGVVPAEMPPSWNIEAHKAQAIAARSYALANQGKQFKHGYDLKDSDEDQVYHGVSGETKRTNDAVDATRGQVLVHKDKIISAYYHASSGGYTRSAKDVWKMDLPYTVPVKSFDGHMSRKGHGVGMSQNGANNLANMGYSAYQILGYFYKNVLLKKLY